MNIQDIVTLARHSELSGVAIKNDLDVITAFINLGMLELYKRFPIKVEEHIVTLEDGVMYYTMPDNFMYALEAHGEIAASSSAISNPIPINDEDSENSIFFGDWTTVQIPSSVTGSYVSIIYVAKPIRVTVEQVKDGTGTLDLPETLIDALLNYVGYRAYLGVKSDAQSENNAHWARFERSCSKAEKLGVTNPADSMSMSGRISNRGFV